MTAKSGAVQGHSHPAFCAQVTRGPPALPAAPDLPCPRSSRWSLWSLSTGTMARVAEGLKQSKFTSKELDLDRQGFKLIRLYFQAEWILL